MPIWNYFEKKKSGPGFLFIMGFILFFFMLSLFCLGSERNTLKNINVGICISKSNWKQDPPQFMAYDSMNNRLISWLRLDQRRKDKYYRGNSFVMLYSSFSI